MTTARPSREAQATGARKTFRAYIGDRVSSVSTHFTLLSRGLAASPLRRIREAGHLLHVASAAEARAAVAQSRLMDAIETLDEGFTLYDAEDRLVLCNSGCRDIYAESADLLVPGARYEDILRESARRGQYADAVGREEEWIAERMRQHRAPASTIEQPLSDGRWLRMSERRTGDGGTVGLRADITRHKAAAKQLAARAFRQEIIAALGESALEFDDDRVLIEEAVIVLAETLQVRFCEVLEVQPDGQHAVLRAGLGWKEGLVGDAEVLLEPGSQGRYTLDGAVPVIIEDLRRETRFAAPPLLVEHGVVSGLTTTIPTHPQPYGIISAYAPEQRKFTVNDSHLIKSVANLLAVAIDRHRADAATQQMEEQLRQAQKMESLGTLAGGIAHDFNNVLVPILGLTKLTMRRLAPESRERANLEKVIEAGQRAKGLVEQILAFSVKGQPEREAVDLGAVVDEGLKLLRATIPATIEIRREIDGGVGLVHANSTQLHQVLINLASNAADAMAPKGGVLTVALAGVEAGGSGAHPPLTPGRYAKLSVSDTGCGIDKSTLKRIFEPFFTTKDVGEGTGLGLSVTHGIVTAHDGAVEVASKPGRGTRFDVYLPVCVEVRDGTGENGNRGSTPATSAGAVGPAPADLAAAG